MLHTESNLETRKILAKNIEDFLSSNNKTMEELGEACDSSKQYIYKLKTAQTNPSLDFLDRLADAMDCKVSDLFKKNHFTSKKSQN